MDIQDMRARYTVPIDNKLFKTFEGHINDITFGKCLCVIYRALRNDNGVAREATIRQLKKNEPNVGFWDGDVIQYFDMDGNLLDEIR